MPTYSNPSALTTNYKLKQFANLANPGAESLNGNSTIIDKTMFAIETYASKSFQTFITASNNFQAHISASISSSFDTGSVAMLKNRNVFTMPNQMEDTLTLGMKHGTGTSGKLELTNVRTTHYTTTTIAPSNEQYPEDVYLTLPSGSGTLARLSDIPTSSSGSSASILAVDNTFTGLNTFGPGVWTNGHVNINNNFYPYGVLWSQGDYRGTLFAPTNLTDDNTWTLPNKNGTIALISDIPSGSGSSASIDDTSVALNKTWSSTKISTVSSSMNASLLAHEAAPIYSNQVYDVLGEQDLVGSIVLMNNAGTYYASPYKPTAYEQNIQDTNALATLIDSVIDCKYVFDLTSITNNTHSEIDIVGERTEFSNKEFTMVSFVNVTTSATVSYRFEIYQKLAGSTENILYASAITTGAFNDTIPFTMHRNVDYNNLYFRFFNLGNVITDATMNIVARGI